VLRFVKVKAFSQRKWFNRKPVSF